MKINFTKKQFESLLKLTYLGEWMANAHRIEDRIKHFEETQSYVFSFAKDFGFKEFADTDNPGVAYPTAQFEDDTEVRSLIEEYDEETFWDELINRLGERDFYEKYSIEEIEKMSPEEQFSELYECIDVWGNEINTHGLSRLHAINMTMRTEPGTDE